MNHQLPQICVRCKKLVVPEKGVFMKSRSRYNTYRFMCHKCRSPAERHMHLKRTDKPADTPIERRVRKYLIQFVKYHVDDPQEWRWQQEFELPDKNYGNKRFDFCFLGKKILIEVDSRKYHRTRRQLINDKFKDRLAKKYGYTLIRIQPCSKMQKKLYAAIRKAVEGSFRSS